MNDSQWASAKLEEVCSLITDGSHFSPVTTSTGVPYVTVRDISNGKIDLTSSARISLASFGELERNGCRPMQHDVLFSKDGTVGKVALVQSNEPFVVLSSLAILRPMADLMIPAFFALCLQSSEFQLAATGQKTGLAIKRVVLKHLKKMSIPVPPLPVQRRIVDLMAHLDNQIANLRLERDAAEELVQALVRHSLSTFLDTQTVSLDTLVKDGVVELGRGHVISKIDLTENPGEFPVYSSAKANNGSIGAYGLHMFDEELITWSVDGGGHLFHRPKHKFSVTNIGGYLRILQPDVVSYKYLSVVLRDLHSRLVFDWQSKAHPSVIRFAYSTIPLPAIELQNGVERLITPSESLTAVLALEIDRLMMLRASLTSCLLSCEIQIPDAYDSLLDGVA